MVQHNWRVKEVCKAKQAIKRRLSLIFFLFSSKIFLHEWSLAYFYVNCSFTLEFSQLSTFWPLFFSLLLLLPCNDIWWRVKKKTHEQHTQSRIVCSDVTVSVFERNSLANWNSFSFACLHCRLPTKCFWFSHKKKQLLSNHCSSIDENELFVSRCRFIDETGEKYKIATFALKADTDFFFFVAVVCLPFILSISWLI